MADTDEWTFVEKPRKLVKILRVGNFHKRPKILFDLPREIRDQIWSYALDEPTLYNRRHKPGCAFHDHAAAYQIPPALLHYAPSFVPRRPLNTSLDDLEPCKVLCVRRQGFGLMKGVSKQVQREAEEIFWENSTVCFPDSMLVSRGNLLIPALQAIPQAALPRIRRLAVWQIEDDSGLGSYEYARAKLPEVLQTMPNLMHLEAPAALIDTSDQHKTFKDLRNLTSLRVSALRQVQVTNGNDYVHAYIAAGGEWKIPSCSEAKSPAQWCLACQDTGAEMMSLIKDLHTYRTRSRDWTGRRGFQSIVSKLERLEPAQPGEKPYVLTAQLDSKRKEHVFHVWGLPIHPPVVRAIEARKAAKRENLANLVRKPPTLPVFYYPDSEHDDDFGMTGNNKALTRQHRAVQKFKDHGVLLEERGNHLKNVAKAETVKARKESVMNGKARKVAEEETRSERKAASKRCGRRAS